MALTKIIGSGIGTVTNQFADANLPAGSVLQVVTGTTSSRLASTSTSYADTGLSVSITPSSSSNKILLIGTHADCFKTGVNNTATSIHLRLVRGSTEILDIADRGLLTGTAIELLGQISFNHLDSPSTTSATTYKTEFHNHVAASLVSVQQQGAGVSTLIAMEIVA